MRRGLSLVEFLVVLAILGLLGGLSIPNLLRWRAQAQLEETTRSLTWTLQQARAEAKRSNSPRCVRVFASGWASGSTCNALSSPTSSPPHVALSTNYGAFPVDVLFQPPYGTTDAPLKKFTLTHRRYSNLVRSVHVVGVTGKVIVR